MGRLSSTQSTWGFYREAQRLWSGVDRRRRARVRRAVWTGTQVTDPRDAELAVTWARFLQRNMDNGVMWRFHWLHGALLSFALLGALFAPSFDAANLVPLVVVVGFLAFQKIFMRAIYRRAGKRAQQAEEVNLQLLGHAPLSTNDDRGRSSF